MRRLALCSIVAMTLGCGGARFGPEWTVAHARPAEPARPAIVLAPIVIAAAEASAPLLVLDADGTVHHAECPMVLGAEGVVRTADGATVLRVEDGVIVGAEGRELYRLEGERLI
nr:hypothetical protein [Myxococcota bacterium]